jgi:hypothetical protein
MNLEDNEVADDPHLEGRTHSLEVGNRPLAYALEKEEEEEDDEANPDSGILN